jgi:Zn-dependent protease
MFNFDLDPVRIIGVMLGFIIGTTIHEFMHAYTAVMLGDTSPRRAGRVTLNPVAHFDPLGFFMFVLLALGVGFFAWGRPVMVNPSVLRGGRKGMALVALAGPASNLVIATVLGLPFRVGVANQLPSQVGDVIGYIVFVNILLFAFNLIPLPPLDGFTVMTGLVSNYWAMLMEPLRRYGPALLMLLIFVPYFLPGALNFNILTRVLGPVMAVLYAAIGGGRLPV